LLLYLLKLILSIEGIYNFILNKFYYHFYFSVKHVIFVIWIFSFFTLSYFIVKLVFEQTKQEYKRFTNEKIIKYAIAIFIILSILELPIFDIHTYLAPIFHGHSFWSNSHLH
jgi:heme/copper-type cytochrome/quinol oxidase subunit 2